MTRHIGWRSMFSLVFFFFIAIAKITKARSHTCRGLLSYRNIECNEIHTFSLLSFPLSVRVSLRPVQSPRYITCSRGRKICVENSSWRARITGFGSETERRNCGGRKKKAKPHDTTQRGCERPVPLFSPSGWYIKLVKPKSPTAHEKINS